MNAASPSDPIEVRKTITNTLIIIFYEFVY